MCFLCHFCKWLYSSNWVFDFLLSSQDFFPQDHFRIKITKLKPRANYFILTVIRLWYRQLKLLKDILNALQGEEPFPLSLYRLVKEMWRGCTLPFISEINVFIMPWRGSKSNWERVKRFLVSGYRPRQLQWAFWFEQETCFIIWLKWLNRHVIILPSALGVYSIFP